MRYQFLFLLVLIQCNFLVAQNIGVGTTTPSEKLQVAGNIKADTIKPLALKITANADEGKVLTSDINGNATWRTAAATSGGNVGYGIWGDCATAAIISEYNPALDPTGSAFDRFGSAVAISGDYAVVGAPSDNVNGASFQGSACVYHYNGSNWDFMSQLLDPAGASGDQFGGSVSISSTFIAIGARNDDNTLVGQGSVSIFRFNGISWAYMTKLTVADLTNENFGYSVALDGNYLAVGCPKRTVGANAQQGTAYTFRFDGTNWVSMATVIDGAGSAGDQFGDAVALHGIYLTISATFSDVVAGGIGRGQVVTYRRSGTTWIIMQRFAGDTDNDLFGSSISLSDDMLVVGTPQDDNGANTNQGAAYIYFRTGNVWTFIQRVFYAEGAASDLFGDGVAIAGNHIIICMRQFDVETHSNQGAALLYTRNGNFFVETKLIADPVGHTADLFGACVAIDDNNKFLIGDHQYNNGTGKVVFGKIN